MLHCYRILFLLLIPGFTTASHAVEQYTMRTDPGTKAHYFTFTSPKGPVRFNHDMHKAEMKEESCLPCHKTKTPTKALKMSRFDERYAHAFCRGCHKEKGRGPVECHECHKATI